MAARKGPPVPRMSEEHRSKIKSSQILNALQEHALGEREMSQTQITAGLGLLKKVLPDLASQDINANLNHCAADPLMELLENIASNGKRAGKG